MEKKNYTVAVDLGCSSVVVAVGEKTPEGLLDVACVVTKPVEGVNAGRIENIELVSRAIREADRKSTRLNSSHPLSSRMPSSA